MQRYAGRGEKNRAEQRLVPVEILDTVAVGAEIVVVLGRGRRVEVARGFDVKTLQQVVSALEAY
jgi:hypothetical protein